MSGSLELGTESGMMEVKSGGVDGIWVMAGDRSWSISKRGIMEQVIVVHGPDVDCHAVT